VQVLTNLNIKIEELLSQNADDFLIAKEIKYEIKTYLSSLDEIFNNSQGKDFFLKHTKKIDGFIKVIYKYLLRKHFGDFLPMSNSIPITLIALGSYGREQLCVYSDIDIMLLYKEVPGFNIEPIMEEFMTIAWDSGLKLGSRVHEISAIEQEVRSDITIKTSIMESRLIYGSNILWTNFLNKLYNIRKYNQKEFILEKLNEHKQRLISNPLCMQANIKDGYGGMRESNMLFWIANAIYGVRTTKDMIGQHFSEDEYKAYRSSLEYIFRIRNALHLIAKKKLDIINFDVLPELSSKLGFKDTPRLVKERQCMSKLFESLHIIHNFSANIVKKISREYLFDKKNILQLRKTRIKKNLYLCENKVYTSYSRKAINLNSLLEELNHLPDGVNKFDNSYIYFAKNTILPKQNSKKIKQEIKKLIGKQNLYPILKMLYNAQLFLVVFPTAKKILNQPQFDGYHIHPVDIHSLNSVKYVGQIKDNFVLNTYNALSSNDRALLNFVTLFHDFGKGRNKEHSLVGEMIFKNAANDLGLKKEDINDGCTVIRNHNYMSYVATTQDIYSQKVILAFTALLGSKRNLDLLFCLTYGDINSVGNNIYTSTNASLLRELYLQSVVALENKALLKDSTRRVKKENAIKNNSLFKEQSKLMQKRILKIESTQLFLIYKAQDIIDIAIDAKDVFDMSFKIENKEQLTIKITRLIPINLGYLLGKLSFLNISGMHIFKLYDNKKYFDITFSQKVDEVDIPFIEEIIQNSIDMTKEFKFKKPNIKENEIVIDLEHSEELAQIQINTKDQKGLFAYIAHIFDKFNVEIQSAKINSRNNKVNDLILVEKNGNFLPNKDEIIKLLIEA
jgi:[protein-PII] uridylyltransferase